MPRAAILAHYFLWMFNQKSIILDSSRSTSHTESPFGRLQYRTNLPLALFPSGGGRQCTGVQMEKSMNIAVLI